MINPEERLKAFQAENNILPKARYRWSCSLLVWCRTSSFR